MLTLEEMKHAANEAITDCCSEVEMLSKIEAIRTALQSDCESYRQLSNFKLRLNRLIQAQRRETQQIDYYDTQLNKIQHAVFEAISQLKHQEINTPFEYNPRKGLIYLIYDSHEELIYKFEGKLLNGKPDGSGIARYANGDVYDGAFRQGLRHGPGKIVYQLNKIKKEGIWKNDKYVEKGAIDYFPDGAVAASYINGSQNISSFDSQLMILPNIDQSGLLAFPITGDSMLPTFSENDVVVCQELQSMNDIKQGSNKAYVILHEGALLLKKIEHIASVDNSYQLRLVSENEDKYLPFDVISDQSTKIFKIVLHIKEY